MEEHDESNVVASRPSLRLRVLLALLVTGGVVIADPLGPILQGLAATHAGGNLTYAYAQPSALPSPVAAGKLDHIVTDGEGNLWIRQRGTSAMSLASGNVSVVTATGGGSINVTHASGLPAINVTLPSASPVPVMANAYATATGYATYCSPSFAGGSSEVTVKGSAGVLVALSVSNPNTTDVYWEAWDASNPTPGTTAPDLCFCIPGGTGANNRAMYDLVLPAPGFAFATGLTSTIVTAANGSSTPGSACTMTLVYK